MDYQTALRILGLHDGYTEEELKKVHRELANKYHPDRNQTPGASEKMKDINEARDVLVKYLKTGYRPFARNTQQQRNNNQHTQNTSNYNKNNQYNNNNHYDYDIERYTMKKYFELLDIIDLKFDEYKLSGTIRFIITKIKFTLDDFEYKTKITNNKQKIDEAFEDALRKIKIYFKELKDKFYEENNINESDVKETINYDCTLREFYKQLLNIKNKYSPKSIIDNMYKELKKITNFNLSEYKMSEKIQFFIKMIKNVPENFESMVNNETDKKQIEYLFNLSIQKIKDDFKEIKKEFYQENNINESLVKETINYDCTLIEFYNQLLKIKEKYSQEYTVEKILEEEIQKYVNYAGYDRIKTLIKYSKNTTLNKIKDNNYQNIKQYTEEMHQDILKVFNRYYSLQQKITKLETTVNEIDDKNIKNKYITIKNRFKTTIKFDELETMISSLETLINEYNLKNQNKLRFQENEQVINQIYKNLIEKYYESLKGYNIATQIESVKELNEFLNQIISLFTKGCEEYRDLSYFNQFNNIEFKNIYNDIQVIKTILTQLNQNKKSNIYIKKKDKTKYDNERLSFYYIDDENMLMYRIGEFDIEINNINKEDIKNLEIDYISLEDVLEQSNYIGRYKINAYGIYRYIVYENKDYMIYIPNKSKTFAVFVNPDQHIETDLESKDIKPELKDKNTTKELILEQLKQRIAEYEKRYTKKDSYEYHKEKLRFKKEYNYNIYEDPYIPEEYNDTQGKRKR